MSWGYKIMVVYLVFVAGIAVMVYKSSTQKIDLVTPDYYAKELKFQERIDAVKKTNALSSKVKYEIANSRMQITLPEEFTAQEAKGDVLLYFPADNGRDIKKEFTTSNRTISIDLPSSIKGVYQLQVNWSAGGSAYYFEENLSL